MDSRTIVDYAEKDQAKEMRDAFYSALQDKVMAHIEDKKLEVARTMFNQPEISAEVEDEAIPSEQ